MISRAMASARHRSARETALTALACAAAALALSLSLASPAAAECPNEALRQESNTNETTGQPYSAGLPDCRAYEMVSPLYKQAQQAVKFKKGGLPAAPGGETAAFASQGDFSNPENYTTQLFGNVFLSQRGASGWITSSAFAPRNVVDLTIPSGLEGDSAPDLRSVRASCGLTFPSKGERETSSPYTLVCARREGEGSWVPSAGYPTVSHVAIEDSGYLGGSSDLSRLFIQPSSPLSTADKGPDGAYFGIYELAGCCTQSSTLRLVNVDNGGKQLQLRHSGEEEGPLLGDTRPSPRAGTGKILGSTYHAISTSGGTVFFTATPNEPTEAEIETVFARVHTGESFETVAVSNPNHGECGACNAGKERRNATFQGASADGSKVFFTTKQELLNLDNTYNLYEYDFKRPEGERLVLLSRDEEGANVSGVVRSSPDGSHVYFIATGALKVEKNGKGEEANGNGEKPIKKNANLYAYNTVTGETKFVAGGTGGVVGGVSASGSTVSKDSERQAQITPDGRYLVFSSSLKVSGDTNNGPAVYRYDFQTGGLEWVSHGAPGFTATNEGKPAGVTPLPGTSLGAEANIDEWDRAISEDGEHIIFTTAEKLQASDVNKAPDVYEWHHGSVSMISDGHDPLGVEEGEAVMSASGSDIFFLTRAQLVGQDTDALRDLYDARVGGGFPKPKEVSCSGEACQGSPSASPSFGSAASSVFTAGGNLSTPLISAAQSVNTKPKPRPLTRAQQLAKALKACKAKPKRKRASCESQARKKYHAKAGKRATSKRHRRGR
jgi:Tol biopolymer transport system component